MKKEEIKKIDDPSSLAEIIEISADAILSIDKNKNIILFNNAAQNMFGYSELEILGKPLDILLPKSVRPNHKKYIREFSNSEDKSRKMAVRKPVTGLTKSGNILALDITIQKHPEKSAFSYTAICRDISERLENARKLEENEVKFRALFNASHQLVILMNLEGLILDINQTGRHILEDNLGKFIGQNLAESDFWATALDQAIIQQAIADMTSNEISHNIVNLLGKANREFIFDIVIKKISLPENTDSLLVMEGRDITDRVKANQSLVDSEGRLSRAQKIAHIGNWEWRIPANQLLWSDEIYNIFGLTKTDFGATYDAFLESIHPDDREKVEAAVIDSLNNDTPYSMIHRIVCPDGTEKIVHEIGDILRTKDGSPLRMDGTVQDITESWNREQKLIEAMSKAQEANYAKDQFLATMSHELRTPLNAIIGFSSLIEGEKLGEIGNETYIEYAKDIHDSGKHLLSMIDEILTASIIELGAVAPNYTYFSFPLIIDEALNLVRGKSQDKSIRIQRNIPALVQNVYQDEKICKQILINLLSNAVKFSQNKDSITITLAMTEKNIEVSVTNMSYGMDAEEMKHLFEPFMQQESAYSRSLSQFGLGLGLSIVKKYTEILGGKISVVSEKEGDTCFTVMLPLAPINELDLSRS